MLSLSSVCGIIALFLLITGISTKRKRAIFGLQVGAMILLLADRYAYIYRGNVTAVGYWMVRISNYLVFALTIGLIFVFNQYLKEMFVHDKDKSCLRLKRLRVVDAAAVIDEALILVSQFTGLFYTFDEANRYQRQPAYLVAYIFPIFSIILQLSVIIQYYKQLSKNMRLSLLIFTLVPVIASMIQLFAYGLSLTNMTLVGLVALLYLFDLADLDKTAKETKIIAERLHARLASAAEIYRLAYDLDIIHDTFSEIMTDEREVLENSWEDRENAQQVLCTIMESNVDSSAFDEVRKFMDFSTLEERLRNRRTITIEFPDMEGVWMRGRFIVSQYTPQGRFSHVLWMVENIDEEKRKRDELINLSERAVAANEAKSSFLANMSHEIRTPINAVLGMNEMILRESEDEEILSYSQNIRTAGNTLLGLINDILDFSKIESGKMEIIPVEYDLSSLINDLVNMISSRAENKGLLLNLDFDKDVPKLLYGDEVRIRQIITNILTNAVKYTEKGSITFKISYEKQETDPDSVSLCVSVRDTGMGIREEDMKKLFTEFERIDEKRNCSIEGTGLGMSITKSFLEMMGSFLEVESVYGEGSNFHFKLKQKVVRWEPLGDYEASYRAYVSGFKKYKEKFVAPDAEILVVDDNSMNLMVFKSLIKQLSVRIDTAGSADEGIALTRTKKYDMLFLDHMMPQKDGIEALHEIRSQEDNPNIETPTICLTANAVSGAREEYLGAGFDDYLTKPIDSDKLEEMMLRYLPERKVKKTEGNEADVPEDVEDNIKTIPESLKALQSTSIDVGVGIKNSGTREAYMTLLKVFYESIDEKKKELEQFYSDEDFKNYTIKVHALKSSARLIGAVDFGEKAQELENAGKSGNYEYIRENHPVLMDEYTVFQKVLESVFPKSEDSGVDKPEADMELMNEVYERIRQAAEDMDCDKLEDIFAEMEEYRIPQQASELWGRLKEASGQFDYDAIIGYLPQL